MRRYRLAYGIPQLTLALSTSCAQPPVRAQSEKPARGVMDPAAKAVMQRHIEAIQPTRPPRYSHVITEMRSGDSPEVRVEQFRMLPDKVLTRITMAGLGETAAGYDGKVGWTVTPLTGPVLLEGDPLKQLKATSDATSMLAIENFVGLALGGRAVVDGREVDAVVGASATGDSATYYFDVKTGLFAAFRAHRVAGQAVDTSTIVLFADYRRLDGALVPTKVTVRMLGHEFVVHTIHVDHDPIDSAKFAPPAAVREMVKRAPEPR